MTAASKKHPMIFSAAEVRALRNVLKTQARRIISKRNSVVGAWKWEDLDWGGEPIYEDCGYLHVPARPAGQENDCVVDRVYSRIKTGARIRVKETWAAVWPGAFSVPLKECNIEYRADTNGAKYPGDWDDAESEDAEAEAPRWREAESMPSWASRDILEVTGVRCERLQDISEADATAEGIQYYHDSGGLGRSGWHPPDHGYVCETAVEAYGVLWDSLHAKTGHGWDANDWLWVYDFRMVQ